MGSEIIEERGIRIIQENGEAVAIDVVSKLHQHIIFGAVRQDIINHDRGRIEEHAWKPKAQTRGKVRLDC